LIKRYIMCGSTDGCELRLAQRAQKQRWTSE
jgi:hypothetical protein